MTPLDLIGWALAIGIAWVILESCIPLESWIKSLIESVKTRRRGKDATDRDKADPPA